MEFNYYKFKLMKSNYKLELNVIFMLSICKSYRASCASHYSTEQTMPKRHPITKKIASITHKTKLNL